MPNICVYCSSSSRIDDTYREATDRLGRLLAANDHTLIYGGGDVGLMGILARSVHDHGGHVVGVIPESLKRIEGVAYKVADEMIVTQTMQERKRIMFSRADAFIVMPGGYGTLEEFLEVLTLRKLGYHDKPIALVNVDNYFDPLLSMFDHIHDERFASTATRGLYKVVKDPESALDALTQPVA